MKQLPVAGKALTIIFAVIFMIGCSSTETTDTGSDAAAEAEARRAAEERAAEQATADRETMAAQQALEDAVAAAGNVVYFDFDMSTLKPEGRDVLDAHIALAKTNTKSIRLDGHTDERGTREYNMALGERRANSVKRFLEVQGVSPSQLQVVSYGEERLAVRGNSEDAHAQNRRVVFAY